MPFVSSVPGPSRAKPGSTRPPMPFSAPSGPSPLRSPAVQGDVAGQRTADAHGERAAVDEHAAGERVLVGQTERGRAIFDQHARAADHAAKIRRLDEVHDPQRAGAELHRAVAVERGDRVVEAVEIERRVRIHSDSAVNGVVLAVARGARVHHETARDGERLVHPQRATRERHPPLKVFSRMPSKYSVPPPVFVNPDGPPIWPLSWSV